MARRRTLVDPPRRWHRTPGDGDFEKRYRDSVTAKPSEHDVVRLLKPLPTHDVPVGSTGTVVFDHTKFADSAEPPAYEVEFTDDVGNTLAVLTVPEDHLEVAWRATKE